MNISIHSIPSLFRSFLNHHLFYLVFCGNLFPYNKYNCGYINLSIDNYKISTKNDKISTKFQVDIKNLNNVVFTIQYLEKKYKVYTTEW